MVNFLKTYPSNQEPLAAAISWHPMMPETTILYAEYVDLLKIVDYVTDGRYVSYLKD